MIYIYHQQIVQNWILLLSHLLLADCLKFCWRLLIRWTIVFIQLPTIRPQPLPLEFIVQRMVDDLSVITTKFWVLNNLPVNFVLINMSILGIVLIIFPTSILLKFYLVPFLSALCSLTLYMVLKNGIIIKIKTFLSYVVPASNCCAKCYGSGFFSSTTGDLLWL